VIADPSDPGELRDRRQPAARAAAHHFLGIGQAREERRTANASHVHTSCDLYASLGLKEEAADCEFGLGNMAHATEDYAAAGRHFEAAQVAARRTPPCGVWTSWPSGSAATVCRALAETVIGLVRVRAHRPPPALLERASRDRAGDRVVGALVNSTRLHSSIGYMPPTENEQHYREHTTEATSTPRPKHSVRWIQDGSTTFTATGRPRRVARLAPQPGPLT
jgi:hypothetical protein